MIHFALGFVSGRDPASNNILRFGKGSTPSTNAGRTFRSAVARAAALRLGSTFRHVFAEGRRWSRPPMGKDGG